MTLYLIQHAESKRKDEDPARPLSKKGWEDIRKVAEYAEKHLHIQVSQIYHSGKLRAQQTAQVLANHLRPTKGVIVAEGLDPLANPKIWKNRLTETAEDIMIVGHLPHLSKLAGELLTGQANRDVVTFTNGCIVCLEKGEKGLWKVRWMITPEVVPKCDDTGLRLGAPIEEARKILEEAAAVAEQRIKETMRCMHGSPSI